MNKVVCLQIIKPINITWEIFGNIIYELQNETRYVKNKTLALYNDWTNYVIEEKNKTGEYPKLIDKHGYKIFSGWAYDEFKNDTECECLNSANYTASIRNICVAYDTHKKDIICGKCSVPTANTNQPIDLHNKSIKARKENEDYIFEISLLSKNGVEKFNTENGRFEIVVSVKDNGSKGILEKIINGEFKISASQIVRKDKKLFLNLCYSFGDVKSELDENKIMGIDLGVAIPVYMAFNFSDKLRNSIIDSRIINQKIMMDKKLSIAKRSCTFTNGGHGRKNKMRVYDKFRNHSHNLSQTINHKWSKYIIDQAVKNDCGTIQMEDLSGINSKSKFLKNWTYYDLQEKIKYKGKEKGINVVKIKPKYTSQRCSECGYIDSENRPDQATFICKKCGYKANADFNAARNISQKDIDKIIDAETKQIEN